MDIGKIFGKWEAGALGYGAFLGAQQPVRQPRNMQEAQRNANIPYAVGKGTLELGIGLIDDLAVPLFATFASKWIPWLKPAQPAIMKATGILGFGVSGGLLARDFQDWQAARSYIAASQQAIPDRRLNPITGFNNKGQVGMQRAQMTGIASPAAGSLLYWMDNNPFAHFINSAISPGSGEPSDPKVKALAYGFVGGAVGGLLGATKGLGKATALSLALGTAAGFYGISQAHNPSLSANVAAGASLLALHPGLAVAGLIYGASKSPGAIGKAVNVALDRTNAGFGAIGGALAKWGNIEGEKLSVFSLRKSFEGQAYDRMQAAKGFGPARRDLWGFASQTRGLAEFTLPRITSGAAGSFLQSGVRDTIAKGFIATAKAPTRWEQSLGYGHLVSQVTVGPTLAYLGAKHYEASRANNSNSNKTKPSKTRTAILAANGGS